jgi:hypothetical protein
MQAYIDPRTRISYASYYIEGLFKLFGKENVEFNKTYFSDLIQPDGIEDFDHYFAFILKNNSCIKRVVVDFRDKNTINMNALNWAEVYGKVNYNPRIIKEFILDDQALKIIPLGPNFGVKIWDNFHTYFYFLMNYLKSHKTLTVSFRTFMSGYNWQRKRLRFADYLQSNSSCGYVFFVSTLYHKTTESSQTNEFRAEFIRSCKELNIEFEGGLLADEKHPFYNNYKDIITRRYFKPSEYVSNIKKSAVVFNTPALWNCLGWKLGEFLAMGKAIISTPLNNEMSYPLEHGKHIHFVNSKGEIKSAVEKLIKDNNYRKHLEIGSKRYFETFLSPEVIIKQLMK